MADDCTPAREARIGTFLPQAWARVLLMLVPLLTLHLLAETWLDARAREARRGFGENVAERLERLAVESDPEQFLAGPLHELRNCFLARDGSGLTETALKSSLPQWRSFAKRSDHAGHWQNASSASLLAMTMKSDVPQDAGVSFSTSGRTASPGSVIRHLGRDLEYHCLLADGAGTPAACFPERLPNQYVLRKLLKALMIGDEAGRETLRRELERPLPALFGLGKTLGFFLANRGRPLTLLYQGRRARFLWERSPERGLLLIQFEPSRELDPFLKAAADLGFANDRTVAYGVRFNVDATWHCFGRAPAAVVARVWKKLERRGRLTWQGRKAWWEFRISGSGNLVFLAVPVPPRLRESGIWSLRLMFLFLILPVGVWLSLSGDRLGPIRRLAIALFLVTALVPTGGMALGTLFALDGRRAVLQGEVDRAQLEALRRIDEGFQGWIKKFQRRLVRVVHDPRFPALGEDFRRLIAPFLCGEYGGIVQIRNTRSEPLFDSHPGSGGMKALMGIFQKIAFETWAPHRLPPGGLQSDPMIETAMRQERAGFVGLLNRPRRFQLMQNGASRLFFLWDFFPEPHLKPALVLFFYEWERLARLYIQTGILERSDLWGTRVRFAAFHQQLWQEFPPRAPFWHALNPALQRSRILKKPVTGTLRSRGRSWRYTIVAGSILDSFSLVALFPDSVIEGRLAVMRQRIGAGMGIALLLAIALGMVISRRLLEPVAAFSGGLQALRQGNYSWVVRVASNDEFGRLAEAFNTLIAELKDLNVARAVQTGLLPAEYKAPPGYDLHGMARFAGDLGGDILECRNLPDGTLLLLIGDVSGHGAASALLMAFVKAAVTLWSGNSRAGPLVLAQRIDRMLRELGGRPRFLAFCGALLDPSRHRLTLVCGGHPYPVLHRPGEASKLLGGPAYPLGSRRRSQDPAMVAIDLCPGDRVVFYTDGLIEARDARGTVLGYDGMLQWVGEAVPETSSARAMVENILARHDRRASGTDDDVTMLILVREEAKA